MKKNEIRFTIKGVDNHQYMFSAEVKNDGKVYYYNKPLTCDCDAKPDLIFKNNQVVCPKCGKTSDSVYTYEDYHKEQLENLHLRLIGEDIISGLKLYKLNTTIEYEDWSKVEDLFINITPEDVDFGYYNPNIKGWVTTSPIDVEERLQHLIKPENRIGYETSKYSTKSYVQEKIEQLLDSIHEEFSIIDTPEGKFILDGEVVQNPLNPKNMYGGGEWFVVTPYEIWMVANNSRQGDNYKFNNVVTESNGAIGRKVPYNPDLAEKLRQLKNLGIQYENS